MYGEGRNRRVQRSLLSADAANKYTCQIRRNTCSLTSQLFSESFSEYSGYVMSLEDAIKLIKEYEVNTTTTFTVAYQTKGFGNSPIGKDFNCFSHFYKILLLITCQNRQL